MHSCLQMMSQQSSSTGSVSGQSVTLTVAVRMVGTEVTATSMMMLSGFRSSPHSLSIQGGDVMLTAIFSAVLGCGVRIRW